MKPKNKFYIFIYGNCQRGLPDHMLLKNAKFVKMDRVKGWIMIDMGGIPIVTKPRTSIIRSAILVEVYEIDRSDIINFDHYYHCPKNTDRELIKSMSGTEGILYFSVEGKSLIKGRGMFVNRGDWNTYTRKNKIKEDRRKKRRKEENEADEKAPPPKILPNVNNLKGDLNEQI